MTDVRQFLPQDDYPVKEIERILGLDIKLDLTRGRRKGRGKAFLPPQEVEIVAITSEYQTLHFTSRLAFGEEVVTSLQHAGTFLRKYHTHSGHRNPTITVDASEGPHIHFPSEKYPLYEGRSSYAYPSADWAETATDGVYALCEELNIPVDVLQLRLFWG